MRLNPKISNPNQGFSAEANKDIKFEISGDVNKMCRDKIMALIQNLIFMTENISHKTGISIQMSYKTLSSIIYSADKYKTKKYSKSLYDEKWIKYEDHYKGKMLDVVYRIYPKNCTFDRCYKINCEYCGYDPDETITLDDIEALTFGLKEYLNKCQNGNINYDCDVSNIFSQEKCEYAHENIEIC